jgi:hypothetical protein
MKRFFQLLIGLFALTAVASGANALTWNPSGTFTLVTTDGGSPPTFTSTNSNWSGTVDLTAGTAAFSFAGNVFSPFAGLTSSATCNSAANCLTGGNPNIGQGFIDWNTRPAGTTFELAICSGSTAVCDPWVVLFIGATGVNSLSGWTSATVASASVLGGMEIGDSCTLAGGNPSSPGETCIHVVLSGTPPSTTPLPATLPLLGTGVLGLWACIRRRKALLKRSFDKVAA